MRKILFWLGLVSVIFFMYFCAIDHAPYIQYDVKNRTNKSLITERFMTSADNVSVTSNGRDITLSGQVNSQKRKIEAGRIANSIEGVRTVTNNLTVATTPIIASPAPITDAPAKKDVNTLDEALANPALTSVETPAKAIATEKAAACQDTLAALVEKEQILFASAQATIKADSYPLLNKIVRAAKQCSNAMIHIHGHTDSSGNADTNLALSKMRAASVAEYLKKHGVTQTIEQTGHGSAQPLVSNKTSEGRIKNRRIEFKVSLEPTQ